MQIYGTAHIHAAQPLAAPHRMSPAQAAPSTSETYGVDQLDISPEADFVSQARDLPDIRADKVAAIKAQIRAGTYDTDEKLDIALNRLLDEIG